MTLTLSILRCPDNVVPETRRVGGGEFSIGRGPENDWVLPDPERHLSKRHCVLAYRSGEWLISDVSANGTFLNRDTAPVGRDSGRALKQGDRLRLGPYEIEVGIETEAQAPAYGASGFDKGSFDKGGFDRGGFGAGGFGSGGYPATPPPVAPLDPFDDRNFRSPSTPAARPLDPFADDVFAPPQAPAANPFLEPHDLGALRPGGGQSVSLGPEFSPIQADREVLHGRPTVSDHTPTFGDAFQPPPPVAPVLPEDWDDDFGLAPKQQPAAPPSQAFAPPVVEAVIPPTPAPPRPPPVVASVPPVAAPIAAPVAAPMPAAHSDALLAAFLRGAGVSVAPADSAALMESLGTVMRALVSGLRQTLIARAAIKGEFRIEQTMIQARGNNPLKFSADDDDAMLALLGAGRSSVMPPAEAVTDALRDIRLHELATIAAMQSAVRALLVQFDPARLLAEDRGPAVLPGAKKARAFASFEELYAKVMAALSDDFDSVFGKAFARAYEQALREAESRDSAA